MTRSEHYVTKPEGHSLGRKVGAAAAAVTLAFALAACEKSTSNSSTPAHEQSTTAPAVAGQSTPEAAQSAAAVPTNEAATPTSTAIPGETVGKTEVLVQQKSVAEMDTMSVIDFAKLPLADHVAYAYLKNPDLKTISPDAKFQPMLVVGYWQDLLNAGVWSKDKTVGEKVVAAIEQTTTNAQTGEISGPYKSSIELVDQLSGSNKVMNDLYNYLGHGSTLVDPDNGKTYTNITYNMVDNSGAVMGETTTFQVFQDIVKLSDGRTIKVYTEGKGVLGQASPVLGAQY